MAYAEYVAKFPTAAVAAADLYIPENDGSSTTLLQDITGASPGEGAELYLTDNSNYSANGGIVNVVSTGERISYSGTGTDGTGDYVTVVYRGLPGGAAASPATAGDTVRDIISAEHYKRLARELIATQGAIGTAGFTAGSVIFQGASDLDEDNANFFWDELNNRLGLGTTLPATLLHVHDGDIYLDNTATPTMRWMINGVEEATVRVDATELYIETGGVRRFTINDSYASSANSLFINDTANASMTLGLTINQDGNDDEILTLKSSDIAHGMTSWTETDSYAYAHKFSTTDGGLLLAGLSEGVTGVSIYGFHTTDNTLKTTSANGAIRVRAALKSGTSVTSVGADGNLFVILNDGLARFIFDAEGDSHQDVGTAWTNFDNKDDAILTRTLGVIMDPGSIIRSKWDEWSRYNEDSLIDAGIMPALTDAQRKNGERALVNTTQVMRLHNGAIWQLYEKLQHTLERLELAETKLNLLEAN